ncbi:unnamed protein product [Ceratitis capitata]|uniref:(Mediterranean fruit fly) hypothetical protein n=1 Tax=Ceratitis capitata TaxID=7213 RepID=A0A811UGJ4_CERCA|nr:unnamed protein product [Ceratitis capitata]
MCHTITTTTTTATNIRDKAPTSLRRFTIRNKHPAGPGCWLMVGRQHYKQQLQPQPQPPQRQLAQLANVCELNAANEAPKRELVSLDQVLGGDGLLGGVISGHEITQQPKQLAFGGSQGHIVAPITA